MAWRVKQTNIAPVAGSTQPQGRWRVKSSQPQPQTPQKQGGVWNTITRNLIKPVASASNLLEDFSKIGGYGIAKMAGYKGDFSQAAKQGNIAPWQHQKDVWSGRSDRTYSDIMREIGNEQSSPVLGNAMKTIGYGGDFILDPLNKLKILGLTNKGNEALKVGNLGLSAGEQATKGERALLQFGRLKTPQIIDKAVLGGTTKLNDAIRATKYGDKLMTVGSKVNSKIRPGGVSRDEFKILSDAKNQARNVVNYKTDKAIEFAKDLSKTLKNRKATEAERSALLHAIEKGDEKLAPVAFQDVWKQGVDFKQANEELWKKLGGATLEGHGLSHIATKEVAEAARKEALKGGKMFSPNTPQDIHRQWMKVDGKISNIGDEGIKYNPEKGFLKQVDKPILTDKGAEVLNAKQYQKDLIKNTAKERKALEESLQGGQTVQRNIGEEGYESYGGSMNLKRISEHSKEYRDYFKQHGKKPPLEFYRKQVEKEIKNGSSPLAGEYESINKYIESARKAEDVITGEIKKQWVPVKVEQASAKEINEHLIGQGKNKIFQEDLPIVAAKMGISTGRKQAGVEFLEAVKNLKGEVAQKLANETYEKMTNVEAINKAIKSFDAIQNIWKSQALVAPSYHIRNVAGNLWNNYLADVKTGAYAQAGKLQNSMRTGKLTTAQKVLVEDMKKHGVIGTGQYGADIAQTINQEIGKTSYINPFSQKNFLYRGNKAVGSAIEDNAKIAHFLSKRADGFGVKQAAESVKKYLFDYSDLTFAEKNLFKRIMPFYTWTSKNIPLQIQQFVENPGKFSKIGTAKKDIEKTVEQPNEKFLSKYISENSPIRIKQDKDGNTQYFLLGQWLPAAAAFNFLSRPLENIIGMGTPLAKLPAETALNKSSFFQNTLGEYQDLKSYPGQKQSYLGLDLDPRTTNIVRSIRVLNELDKLNPGSIFGGKNEPSMWNGIFDNASQQRGGRFTPESTQADRIGNMFVGKLNNYNPKDAKFFYDRDTDTRVAEIESEIKRAMKNKQVELAEKLVEQKKAFIKERRGGEKKSFNPFYSN